ncbi:hypothetical protein WMY93_027751 [Mugilogobius chulae]|uniref:Uncharacterized protein n=1 Tax=Mugilogobius chulae TaxID=88201 RepID=A0AAW0N438_9GOBI
MQKEHRQKEMTERKELYRFKVFEEGLPYRAHYDSEEELPLELQRSPIRTSESDQTQLMV